GPPGGAGAAVASAGERPAAGGAVRHPRLRPAAAAGSQAGTARRGRRRAPRPPPAGPARRGARPAGAAAGGRQAAAQVPARLQRQLTPRDVNPIQARSASKGRACALACASGLDHPGCRVTSPPLTLWQRLALAGNGALALRFAVVWAGLAWAGEFW